MTNEHASAEKLSFYKTLNLNNQGRNALRRSGLLAKGTIY
jgi:hypothetical protein